eukprot:scaffold1540_cov359-Prasinococcus_capsulatus_cf.AAC.6
MTLSKQFLFRAASARDELGMSWMSMPPPSKKEKEPDEREKPAEEPEVRVGLWRPPNSAARIAERGEAKEKPAVAKPSGVGDGGASWRQKALKRAIERAKAEGKSVRDELEDRFGSEALAQLAQLDSQHVQGASRLAHLQAARERRRGMEGDSRQQAGDERRERSQRRPSHLHGVRTVESQMQSPSAKSLSMSWRKPSSRDRGRDSERDRNVGRDRGQGHGGDDGNRRRHDRSDPALRASAALTDDATASRPPGNQNVAAALRARLGMKPSAVKSSGSMETSASEANRVAARRLLDADKSTSASGAKPMQQEGNRRQADFQDGQRVRYFSNDNNRSLDELVREERIGANDAGKSLSQGARGGLDDQLARSIAKRPSFRGMSADDEYDHNMGVHLLEHKGKAQKRRERGMDASEQRRQALQAKSSKHFGRQIRQDWLEMYRHLIVAFGNRSYLMAPPKGHLVDGHCYIVPAEHTTGTRTLEEEAWQEVRNFKKCLMAMAQAEGKQVIFIETAMHLSKRQSFVEAIPVPTHVFRQAPLYFKKAIDEAESEWSQHAAKKLIDTSTKGLRGSIPPNFPYFHVEFGIRDGLAHVIDDEESFSPHFGRNVLVGMLQLPPEVMHQRLKGLSSQQQNELVDDLREKYTPHDWTHMLAD